MNKKRNIILGIILIVIIILCAIYVDKLNNYNEKIYSNVIIDKSKLNIFYFDVGQADCTLITLNNKNILIDAGNQSDGEYIVKFLKEKEIDNIDYFIITHGDLDHSGGAGIILNGCKVDKIFMPEGIEESETNYQKLKTVVNEKGLQLSKVKVNDRFEIDNANFEILSVKNNSDNTANESSIVLKLNYINTSYLFMGDATQQIENEINCGNIDVLKVGHHGSETSTSSKFLKMINPTYAIISAGDNKKYNNPSNEVLQRLNEAGIQENNIYITKKQGTVWITSDGEKIEIQTRKDINLDGTGQELNKESRMSIYSICSFFICKNYSLQAQKHLHIFLH